MRIEALAPSGLGPIAFRALQPSGVIESSGQTLTAGHARSLLAEAWRAELGDAPPDHAVALLTAQWALETDGGRHMPGHNFGGIKASTGSPGANFRTVEGYGAGRREIEARFRIYPNAEAGARDYLRLLAHRYPAALAAARAGDLEGFSGALARGGYFTADPDAYARGLAARVQAQALASSSEKNPETSPPALREAALLGLVHAFQRDRA